MNRIRAGHAFALAMVITASSSAGAQVGRRVGMLDPNVATEAELRALPNITDAIATMIIARRPFLTMAEFDAVISPSLARDVRAELYRRAFVPLNLNSASREEILLIPGMGARMLRQFQENRPYRGLTTFRAEIGRGIAENELARLEQYVYTPMDLNSASDEDILGIPGVSPKLLKEIKEHRPFKNLQDFRKEVGKSWGQKEVARLERYLVLTAP